jgi:hypothetical protein
VTRFGSLHGRSAKCARAAGSSRRGATRCLLVGDRRRWDDRRGNDNREESGRLTEINGRESLELLRSEGVGRLAAVVEGRPEIFPVNFSLDASDSIVMQTAIDSTSTGKAGGASWSTASLIKQLRSSVVTAN